MQKEAIVQAKTFTCQYVKREDRLLFTINYKDVSNRIDFWVTRSFLLKLLPYFFEYSTIDVASKREQADMSNADSTDNSTFLLTQKQPILLDSVDFARQKDGNIKIVFKNLEKKIYCISILNEVSLMQLFELITKAAPAIDWGVFTI